MNQGKYVFAQISSFLAKRVFDTLVSRYKGDYRIRHFSCWNQLLCMMYGQLSNRDSLSDLVLTVNAHSAKAYHLGFGKGISKANLGKSNTNRDYRIYQDFAYHLIAEARKICLKEDATQFSFSSSVYAFDSTTIDLCLNVFCWATFRKAKGAIKLHTQYDIRTSIPVFMHLTAGSVHDVKAMDEITYEPGSFYVFDRGYLDFKRLFVIHEAKSFFVIRAKNNLQFKRQYSAAVNKKTGVQCDQAGELKGFYSSRGYPEKIRRIKFYDEEQDRNFVFLTNNLQLSPQEIAALYKHRWKIELFFKWIKQHLKIKSFWGTTENAVRTQVYIAIITYTLIAIIRQLLKTEYTTYEVLQILGSSLLDKTPINQLLKKPSDQDVKELLYNQLKIF
ncbi:MAG: IS4 family transposase [Bacteroidia bacterium]|nr:IS4 family transposase [Bacteroidia bacterium]